MKAREEWKDELRRYAIRQVRCGDKRKTRGSKIDRNKGGIEVEYKPGGKRKQVASMLISVVYEAAVDMPSSYKYHRLIK